MARPTDYDPAFCERAASLCENGALDVDLAAAFDVTVRTIHAWKVKHPEFLHSIKRSKEIADDLVEESLFRRATGYSHDAVKINVSGGDVIVTPYTEHYPPDTAAAIFWLKNRRKNEWRDRQEHELSGPGGTPLFSKMTDEELESFITSKLPAVGGSSR